MELPIGQISAWVGAYFYPFFRIGAFLMAMPIIGTQLVPIRIRLILALVITMVVVPLLPAMPAVEGLSVAAYLLVGQQVLIGVAMAFVLQLLFQVFVVAGQMMAMQMGLGFASMVDPVNGVNVAVLSQFYLMLVMLLFLVMNGHLVAVEVLIESFRTMPVGGPQFEVSLLWQLAHWSVWMFASGVLVSLPAVTAILVVNFAFGIMNRAAPQLNVFSLGFPFTMLFGLVIVLISLTGFLPQFHGITEQALIMLQQFTGTLPT